ncbi:MAG: ABC transporter substrate-binding protein, partial [Anaerolineales bacterium]
MKKLLWKLFLVLALTSLVITACAQTPAPTEAPAEEEPMEEPMEEEEEAEEPEEPAEEEMVETTLTLGYTASLTGRLNVSSGRQDNGLQLYIQDLQDAGGFEVGNETITFEPIFYDDESTNERVQELYTRLATEDDADFLISPYSSGLTGAAAVIAEQYGKVMITTGAA